jgi:hypothetical protein
MTIVHCEGQKLTDSNIHVRRREKGSILLLVF